MLAICVRGKAFTSARPASVPCPPQYLRADEDMTSLLAATLRSASALHVCSRIVVVA